MQPGNIVKFRNRDWVVFPSEDETIYKLRPLTGLADEVVIVHKKLCKFLSDKFPEESVSPSCFNPPTENDLSDSTSAYLLWQAARLSLSDGAVPLRSLGKISVRPRKYQFVPLLMALRLDPIRLFIADDVGVGKTIEALLIARELLDRGEINSFAVLCPPYLCDQWEKEIREKFNLEAVIIGAGTISLLERRVPKSKSIYEFYPFQVISIDWVKSEKNKYQFLQFCPPLVIVDEVHGAAEAGEYNKNQQQRHQLLKEIAKDSLRHLIFLTATPHSGIESAFKSLLVLLNPEFDYWNLSALNEEQKKKLAMHFIQRTRQHIIKDWKSKDCFPKRETIEKTYFLSDKYKKLFKKTFDFCSEIIQTGKSFKEYQRRMRYWGALALLRCIMSSPASALSAIKKRTGLISLNEDESELSPYVFESVDTLSIDETPIPPIEGAETTFQEIEKNTLKNLANLASELFGPENDTKLKTCIFLVKELIKDGFNPIIWCRYVDTAEYVGKELKKSISSHVQVVTITGRLSDEERKVLIEAISMDYPRVLVATDCLSEGINLQEKFNAVIHYDLPWNPNRLEQREGRVDRLGQQSKLVKAILLYGIDNPIDGAVIEVLIKKAREIYKTLGTYVPVPQEAETVMEALLNAIFFRQRIKSETSEIQQLMIFDSLEGLSEVKKFYRQWDSEVEREKTRRSIFAQQTIKPDIVAEELKKIDSVLGDSDSVKKFVLSAFQRLGIDIRQSSKNSEVYIVNVSPKALFSVPEMVRNVLLRDKNETWKISFVSPPPESAEYIGRNHKLVRTLANFLLEDSLNNGSEAIVSRCGVIRTRAVNKLTVLLLLRVRYLIQIPEKMPLLSEEILVTGFIPYSDKKFLDERETLYLLTTAQPSSNIPFSEKKELLKEILEDLGHWSSQSDAWGKNNWIQQTICQKIIKRAEELAESHKQIRKAVFLSIRNLKVSPQFPPDLLGIFILQPEVKV
jgi:SNF2 family DNA or RNA helicase